MGVPQIVRIEGINESLDGLKTNMTTNAYKKTPYVRGGEKTKKNRDDRSKWSIDLKQILAMTDSELVHACIRDGILPDLGGQTCHHCEQGVLSELRECQGRGLRYRCNHWKCRKFVLPHVRHPLFTCGSGSRLTTFNVQCAVLFVKLAGLTNVGAKRMLSDVNHKVFENMTAKLHRARSQFVVAKEKKLVFGTKRAWVDVEADEAVFGKKRYVDDEGEDMVEWEQWAGVVQRGKPESLVLVRTRASKTRARAPGPGAIKKVDWIPIATKYLQGRHIVLHTDRAKSYNMRFDGVVHDSVRHCKKRVKVQGKWTWTNPVYVRLSTQTLPDGSKLRTTAGTDHRPCAGFHL